MAKHELHDGNDDGMSLGASATQKVGFFGETPVVQQTLVTNTSGTLGNTNAAVDAILSRLEALGLFADT